MKRTKVIEARVNKDLTQVELAKIVEVSQNTISQIENGTRTPSAAVLNRLCKALELSIDAFFEVEKMCS